ncbi:hypothetical protein DSC45_26375 [Streptomyces sp. YIM 130001]|uniref:TIGR03086 family metal-binding protein n=1 Tax=Streptomyces sp. YIM 130001 TaxID=2259644 RepID=UPI000E64B18F|nr:TIGR03086 family metal-binding protein [Streptomyces sp. YIM 130001]RII12394.1 hypothetical protein DSC45_26375 [Streptomyces sp. YIM 130001]
MAHDELLGLHAAALDLFADRVHRVGEDQWGASTPCTEWSVRDLVQHLTAEQLWVPPLVRDGATMAEVGDVFDADVVGGDPATAFDTAAQAAREAFREPGALDRTVNLSYGDTPCADYCAQMVTDLVVHSWDLSRGIGADEQLPDELVAHAVREVAPYASELAASGVFGPPVKPPAGADEQTKLLAQLGRRV